MPIILLPFFTVFSCVRGYQLDFVGVASSERHVRRLLRRFYYKHIREEYFKQDTIKFDYRYAFNHQFNSDLTELVIKVSKVNNLRDNYEEHGLYSG